jgi:hypothetical protein
MVKRKLTVGGLIGHLASVLHFHKCKKVNTREHALIFLICIPHAISIWNIIPGSLLPLFKCDPNAEPERTATSAPSLS